MYMSNKFGIQINEMTIVRAALNKFEITIFITAPIDVQNYYENTKP